MAERVLWPRVLRAQWGGTLRPHLRGPREPQEAKVRVTQRHDSWSSLQTLANHDHSLSFSCELSFSISRSAEVTITLLLPCSRTSSLMSTSTVPDALAAPQGIDVLGPALHRHLSPQQQPPTSEGPGVLYPGQQLLSGEKKRLKEPTGQKSRCRIYPHGEQVPRRGGGEAEGRHHSPIPG